MKRKPLIKVSPPAERTRQTFFGTHVFASKTEARRYDELALLLAAGHIDHLLVQVPFRLPGGTKYTADFLYRLVADGRVVVEDVKGYKTAAYIRAKKQVEDLYRITIAEPRPR